MTRFSIVEQFIIEVDYAIRTLSPPAKRLSDRPSPAANLPDMAISGDEKQKTAALMRVNHSGEVCAQALYQGQALTALNADVKLQMTHAALEETDHLAWCEERLAELGEKPSVFNPLWYGGSLLLGALAGLAGDRYSLGFLAETEHQVSAHLKKHLQRISINDKKTTAILEQMHKDETAHAETALQAGGKALPIFIKGFMNMTSKIMTTLSYYK